MTDDHHELRRSLAEQAALRRVATLIAHGAARTDIIEALLTEVGRLIPVTDAALLRSPGEGTVTVIGRWNELTGHHHAELRLPSGSGALSRSIRETKRPIRINDDANASGPPADLVRGWGWGPSAGAPVIVGARVWGLVVVGTTGGATLPPDTEERLTAFTELLAGAIAHARSREEIDSIAAGLVAEQAALRQVAELVAHDAPPGDVLESVVTEAASLVGVAFTTLLRFDPDGATEVVAVHDPPAGVAVGMRAPATGDGSTQRVWRTGRPARTDQLNELSGAWGRLASSNGFLSSAAAPVVAEDRLWGTLVAAGRRTLPAQIEEKLARFAELAGTAIASSQARADAQALADEQSALLRVAEQVARGDASDAVFAAVAAEARQLLDGQPVTLVRYEEDESLIVVSRSGGPAPPGTRIPYEPGSLPDRVRRSAVAVRVDDYRTEPNAARAREYGLAAAVAAPIEVESRVWGTLTATSADGPVTRGTEERLQRFANLVATAVSNTTSRAQLIASRARVLSTADETRRRLQRDVHDGAQQRLVHTVITLKLARHSLAHGDLPTTSDHLEEALKHAHRATDELREIISGILPAALTRNGLRGGVESLLADQSLPVDAVVDVPRMAVEVETTAYFVIAEALTNVVKHARAGRVWVRAGLRADALRIEVGDDGVGGARAGAGSGLTGLFDRVEARGGQLRISSPPGNGTTIEATLPIGPTLHLQYSSGGGDEH
ncbi:GAF domain-containing sensor histidine kinase [Actinoplanes sp. M2I2]|uniref:GAF domain-containing sensor histidine kinase n=1 Tax=Actinoplanes sp. M2I2 TaxID=1734444 RepID=UPI002022053C|nr:GAF domain-containing protein [Actinoplanes sp. M2I2]